jgi:hypothetical protein
VAGLEPPPLDPLKPRLNADGTAWHVPGAAEFWLRREELAHARGWDSHKSMTRDLKREGKLRVALARRSISVPRCYPVGTTRRAGLREQIRLYEEALGVKPSR